MQTEVTQIDYRHPLQAITPGTMATYRKPYSNHGARCWRPIAALILKTSDNGKMVRVRIAGWQGSKYTYREMWVQRCNLYPAVVEVQAYLSQYAEAKTL